ncbi:MAG: hydrogenase-4 component B [Motiliproteus sp.]|jgi:hydrogenase-4 component B
MDGILLLSAWLSPLMVLLLTLRKDSGVLLPLAALPALVTALMVPAGSQVEIPWLLLGTRLGVGEYGALWLFFSALLWLVAACYTHLWIDRQVDSGRFRLFFLLAMSGNFGVILAQDLVSFYLGFTVMGVSAYGLVVHGGKPEQRRAGRVYLWMTLVGELALFAALVMIYQRTGSLSPSPEQLAGAGHVEIATLVLAFGIKAGVLGVHFWLPLAHPAAPVPASAVLSGAMIKTALIGWINFLPLGQEALPLWGILMMVLGCAASLFAVPAGLMQRDPKVLLAYSSIGKMGTMVAVIGLALLQPSLSEELILAVVFYTAHHGLAKGALFIGVGLVKGATSRVGFLLLALPALAMVGAPFTSGAAAKGLLKESLNQVDPLWGSLLLGVMLLATLGTTLLMARFMVLMNALNGSETAQPNINLLPWAGLILVLLFLPLFGGQGAEGWSDLLVIITALIIAIVVLRSNPGFIVRWVGCLPPGDMVCWIEKLGLQIHRALKKQWQKWLARFEGLPRLSVEKVLLCWKLSWNENQGLIESGAMQAVLWFGIILLLLLLLATGA